MAVTTKKTFNAVGTGGQGTLAFTPVSIELNNQDDLDVYVTKASAGISANNGLRIKHYRQNTSSNLDANHPQVNDTTGLYFPALTHTGGTETLENYTLSADNNTITFNSALPSGAVVSIERRTRDSSSDYTNFAGGSTIRSTQLNDAFDESNFTAQEARNKAFDLEGKIFGKGATSTSFITSDEIVDGTIVGGDIATDTITASNLAPNSVGASELANNSVDTDAIVNLNVTTAKLGLNSVTSEKIADGTIVNDDINASANIQGTKLANDSVTLAKLGSGALPTDITVASANIVNGTIVDVDVASGAAIAHTKLAGAAAGKVLLGNSSNVVTATTLSGDVTVNSSGVTTIGNDKIDSQHYVDGSIDHAHLANDIIDGDNIQDNCIDSEHYIDGSIDTEHIGNISVTGGKLAPDCVDSTKIQDNAIDSEHYIDGSIDHEHLANDIIDGDNIQDDAIAREHIADSQINSEHYADGSIDVEHLSVDSVSTEKIVNLNVTTGKIANDAVTADKIADAVIVTASEQASHSVNDTTFFTTSAAEARYFNASTGETIKDGQTFPDNDTTIATTAAINDRIIDLVDDVGGFVPIANETSFPNANPDVNNGTGTIVSIGELASNHTSNGSGVITISNGTVGNSTVTITGAANNTTYSAGYGLLVETTTTLNTYTFHRLTTKATEVTTVASNISNVNTVAGSISNVNAVAGNASNINAVAADATDIGAVAGKATEIGRLGTADAVSDMNTLGTTAIVSDMDTLADISSNISTVAGISGNVTTVAGISSNVTTVAGIHGNVTTVAGNNSNVTTVAGNISDVNNFADLYQIASSNPSTDGGGNALAEGDLYFNTSANELKVYNGSAWQGGVTASGNFASTTGNTFTGNNTYNDGIKARFGTGNDLEIYHDGSGNSIIQDDNNLYIKGNSVYIQTNQSEASGYFKANGAVELYYDNVKKFDTTSNGVEIHGTLQMDDSKIARFGNDGDLQIYHTGSHSYVSDRGGVGNLNIESNNQVNIKQNDAEHYMAKFVQGGATELYHNNFKSFQTDSDGIVVYAPEGNSANVYLYADEGDDNADKWRVQASNNGNLYIENKTSGAWEKSIHAEGNGLTALYYDNAKKFETVSHGVTITGNAFWADNGQCQFGNVFGSADLTIYHDGADSYIRNGTGELKIMGDDIKLRSIGGEVYFKATANGSTELYYNNAKTLKTHVNYLELTGNASECNLQFLTSDGTQRAVIGVTNSNSVIFRGGSEKAWEYANNGALTLYYDDSAKLATAANGITVSGNRSDFLGSGQQTVVVGSSTGAGAYLILDGDSNGDAAGSDYSYIAHKANGHVEIACDNPANNANFEVKVADGTENAIVANANAQVELYYNNAKKFQTKSNGIIVSSATNECELEIKSTNQDGAPSILFVSDNADDNDDNWRLRADGGGVAFGIQNYADGSWESNIVCKESAAAELYYDNVRKLETYSGGVQLDDDLVVKDNNTLRIGDGYDLQLYHNSSNTNSYIAETGGGNLIIQSSQTQILNAAGTEMCARFDQDGAVELYHNGVRKLNTEVAGIRVDGASGANGILALYANAGNSNSNLWRLESTNSGSNFYIKNSASGSWENNILTSGNGSVRLYYDNSPKFQTDASGVTVTGSEWISEGTIYLEKSGAHHHRILANDSGNDLAFQQSSDTGANTNFTTYLRIADGGAVSLPQDNQQLRIGAGDDIQLYHNSGTNYWKNQGSTVFKMVDTGGDPQIECNNNGNVELYYNGNKAFNTTSTGIEVRGTTDGANCELYMYADRADDNADLWKFTASPSASQLAIQNKASGSWENSFIVEGNGVCKLYNDNSLKLTVGGDITVGQNAHVNPYGDNAQDLGSASYRWRNVYTTDLQLSNEGSANNVDGTWGSYTIQEGEDDLFLINRRNGKKYKFNLTEVS